MELEGGPRKGGKVPLHSHTASGCSYCYQQGGAVVPCDWAYIYGSDVQTESLGVSRFTAGAPWGHQGHTRVLPGLCGDLPRQSPWRRLWGSAVWSAGSLYGPPTKMAVCCPLFCACQHHRGRRNTSDWLQGRNDFTAMSHKQPKYTTPY